MSEPIDNMFRRHAMAQDLKEVMRLTDSWPDLRPDVKETLEQIQGTVAAVLNGADGSAQWLDLANLCIQVAETIDD